ncbi:MAG: carboxypeptidase regulatory-like domain-containing protein [Candidatus Methylomirabilales bacterium]
MRRPLCLPLVALALPALAAAAALAGAAPAAERPGSIAGRVTFAGPVPPEEFLVVTKDVPVCGARLPAERLVMSPEGGLANAVVFLEAWPGEPPAPPMPSLTVDNRGCRFVPRVAAAQVGTTLTVRNSDPLLHNLRAFLDDQPVLNVVLTVLGQVTERRLRRAGVQRLRCDVHPHMEGHLLVFDHPGFAVTDASGTFRISGVPPGRYTVKAWHEGWRPLREGGPGGVQEAPPPVVLAREVMVPPGGEATIAFTFGHVP